MPLLFSPAGAARAHRWRERFASIVILHTSRWKATRSKEKEKSVEKHFFFFFFFLFFFFFFFPSALDPSAARRKRICLSTQTTKWPLPSRESPPLRQPMSSHCRMGRRYVRRKRAYQRERESRARERATEASNLSEFPGVAKLVFGLRNASLPKAQGSQLQWPESWTIPRTRILR